FIAYEELSERDVRYGWAGWTPRQRAQALTALDEEIADRGDPIERRCGVLQGLWALVPALGPDEGADEYSAIARSTCGQVACPCPVLTAWRAQQS
ncbi:MAG: hypothetical protein KIT58_06610, partial [Planctomycetota bacterium]|nr:hypothetical protein [Planctomycetota bacterium]